MKNIQSRFSNLALGAAVAGILAGTMLVGGCGKDTKSDPAKTEGNGCNGPNGCGAEKKAAMKTDKNACNGHNGCSAKGATEKAKEGNGCQGHTTPPKNG